MKKGTDMKEKYERQMKKGVLDMLVLKLLETEPKHGYRIIQEMKEKSEEVFSLKDGTLYPVLYRLEDDGLVISRWSEIEEEQMSQKSPRKNPQKVPRKYYEITEAGRKALTEMWTVWERILDGTKRIMEE